jgi:ubiquinone/menaquinone biosynthesis C-methylase UbiE
LHQYHLAYSAIHSNVVIGSKILDWGGGSGHFSCFLNKQGYATTIFAFDQPQFVLQEIEQGEVSFVPADPNEPTALPFADDSFDAVCSIGVLEHVRETGGSEVDSLREIRRVLKPGGLFLCYHFPNRNSWIERVSRLLGRYSHQYTYTREDIDQIFSPLLNVTTIHRYALLPRNSLRRLPSALSNAKWFARTIDFLDRALSIVFRPFTQNWLVMARKPKS